MRSSISDFGDYLGVCRRALSDDATFVSFKRHPAYTAILEHVSPEQGLAYLQIIVQRMPQLVAHFDRFRQNDALGNPRTATYSGYGTFSPTTLRYIKVLGDLLGLFGDLRGLNIVEIGGGYGGQCLVTSMVCAPASYTVVDLPECARLQERYLGAMRLANFRCVGMEQVESLDQKYDLVISNYAFTECVAAVQRVYLDRLIKPAARGYITCNFIGEASGVRSMSREELLGELPGAVTLPEEPLTGQGNFIWMWK